MSEHPSDWRVATLGDVVNKITSGGTPKADNALFYGGDIPFLKIDDITASSKYLRSHKNTITELGLQESSAKIVPSGTLLLTMYGTIGECCITTYPVATNQAIACFLDHPGIELDYLYYCLRDKAREFSSASSQTTQANISATILKQTSIAVPPLTEQKKIAKILSGIDMQIYALERKISKIISTKTEVSRDLFSCFEALGGDGVCLKGGDVKTMSLDSICEAVVDCKNRTPPYTESGHPVVRTPNVRNGKLVRNDLKYTDVSSYKIWTERSVPRPMDVLFTREAPLGEVCLVPENFKCCLGQRMMLFRANKSLIDPQYLLFSLMSPFVQDQLLKSKGGTTVGHARVADIRDLLIPVFPKEEQLRIASVFSSIETFLEGLVRKKEKLAIQKSALASDLLSGRKRVGI